MAKQLTLKQKCWLKTLNISKVAFGSILMPYWASLNYISGIKEFQEMQNNHYSEINHRFCCCTQRIQFRREETDFYIKPNNERENVYEYDSSDALLSPGFPHDLPSNKKPKTFYHYLYCGHFIGERIFVLCLFRNLLLFIIPLLYTLFFLAASIAILVNNDAIYEILFGHNKNYMDNEWSQSDIDLLYIMIIMRLSNLIVWITQFIAKIVFGELGGVGDSIRFEDYMHDNHRRTHYINYIKYLLRIVASINFVANIIYFYLCFSSNPDIPMFYINIIVMIGMYFSFSDWFYFDKEAEIYQFKHILVVFVIDIATNWIRLIWGICLYSFLLITDCILLPIPIIILLIYYSFNYCFCLNEAGDTKWQCAKWENVFEKKLHKEYVFKVLGVRQLCLF